MGACVVDPRPAACCLLPMYLVMVSWMLETEIEIEIVGRMEEILNIQGYILSETSSLFRLDEFDRVLTSSPTPTQCPESMRD